MSDLRDKVEKAIRDRGKESGIGSRQIEGIIDALEPILDDMQGQLDEIKGVLDEHFGLVIQ